MSHLEIIVYTWPESQKCSDCKWGCFIQSKMLNNSDYQCTKGCTDNDGVNCSEYNYREGKEDDIN